MLERSNFFVPDEVFKPFLIPHLLKIFRAQKLIAYYYYCLIPLQNPDESSFLVLDEVLQVFFIILSTLSLPYFS